MPPPLINIRISIHCKCKYAFTIWNEQIKFDSFKKNEAMLIKHNRKENKGAFIVEVDGNILAEMIYNMPSENRMIIEHTEVSEELKGQNIGFQLVQAAVDYARQNNIKIIPMCTFAHSIFRKKPDFQDVLETTL